MIGKKHRLAQRDSFEDILKSRVEIESLGYVKDFLSSMTSVVCILNDKNQIIYSNPTMLEKYGLDLEENILGARPGEFFNCVNVNKSIIGCGTSDKCEYCGAFKAIEGAWSQAVKVTHDCRIVASQNGSFNQYDLEITAVPIQFEKKYLIVSIEDITEKKRKVLMERIFFHDIINIAGSLKGLLEVLPKLEEDGRKEFLEIAQSLTNKVIDEIKAQQQTLKAESGELTVHPREVSVSGFLGELADQIRFHNVAQEKHIQLIDQSGIAVIHTDDNLLTRVLINMVKNAMEAVNNGETITLNAEQIGDQVRLSVHNQSVIPDESQGQIFQRFYSTKGEDRGFGTYSMKLIGEQYLNGKVGFSSSEEAGTLFYIDLPVI